MIFLLSLSFSLLISSRTMIIFRTTSDSLVQDNDGDNDIEPNDDSNEEIHIQVNNEFFTFQSNFYNGYRLV